MNLPECFSVKHHNQNHHVLLDERKQEISSGFCLECAAITMQLNNNVRIDVESEQIRVALQQVLDSNELMMIASRGGCSESFIDLINLIIKGCCECTQTDNDKSRPRYSQYFEEMAIQFASVCGTTVCSPAFLGAFWGNYINCKTSLGASSAVSLLSSVFSVCPEAAELLVECHFDVLENFLTVIESGSFPHISEGAIVNDETLASVVYVFLKVVQQCSVAAFFEKLSECKLLVVVTAALQIAPPRSALAANVIAFLNTCCVNSTDIIESLPFYEVDLMFHRSYVAVSLPKAICRFLLQKDSDIQQALLVLLERLCTANGYVEALAGTPLPDYLVGCLTSDDDELLVRSCNLLNSFHCSGYSNTSKVTVAVEGILEGISRQNTRSGSTATSKGVITNLIHLTRSLTAAIDALILLKVSVRLSLHRRITSSLHVLLMHSDRRVAVEATAAAGCFCMLHEVVNMIVDKELVKSITQSYLRHESKKDDFDDDKEVTYAAAFDVIIEMYRKSSIESVQFDEQLEVAISSLVRKSPQSDHHRCTLLSIANHILCLDASDSLHVVIKKHFLNLSLRWNELPEGIAECTAKDCLHRLLQIELSDVASETDIDKQQDVLPCVGNVLHINNCKGNVMLFKILAVHFDVMWSEVRIFSKRQVGDFCNECVSVISNQTSANMTHSATSQRHLCLKLILNLASGCCSDFVIPQTVDFLFEYIKEVHNDGSNVSLNILEFFLLHHPPEEFIIKQLTTPERCKAAFNNPNIDTTGVLCSMIEASIMDEENSSANVKLLKSVAFCVGNIVQPMLLNEHRQDIQESCRRVLLSWEASSQQCHVELAAVITVAYIVVSDEVLPLEIITRSAVTLLHVCLSTPSRPLFSEIEQSLSILRYNYPSHSHGESDYGFCPYSLITTLICDESFEIYSNPVVVPLVVKVLLKILEGSHPIGVDQDEKICPVISLHHLMKVSHYYFLYQQSSSEAVQSCDCLMSDVFMLIAVAAHQNRVVNFSFENHNFDDFITFIIDVWFSSTVSTRMLIVKTIQSLPKEVLMEILNNPTLVWITSPSSSETDTASIELSKLVNSFQ